ncbi:hypothetical protein V1527DRAFT_451768, partial [Lipomyces starkeyi]
SQKFHMTQEVQKYIKANKRLPPRQIYQNLIQMTNEPEFETGADESGEKRSARKCDDGTPVDTPLVVSVNTSWPIKLVNVISQSVDKPVAR